MRNKFKTMDPNAQSFIFAVAAIVINNALKK